MNESTDGWGRTLDLARRAVGLIEMYRLAADPFCYEVLYHYANGDVPLVNAAVDGILAREGRVTVEDIHGIHAVYFGGSKSREAVEVIRGKVATRVSQIMATLDHALGNASKHSETLAGASVQLGSLCDGAEIRDVLRDLIEAVQVMKKDSRNLEARLAASKSEITKLQIDLEAVRLGMVTDPLTSLANRRRFEQVLSERAGQALRSDEFLSLIFADIDHFKRFNDNFGHPTGDQVLRLVADALKQNVKGPDLPARYGGEEFAIILVDTQLPAAVAVADQIRRAVAGKQLVRRSTGEPLGRITISCGVAQLRLGENVHSFLERADKCLYVAKRGGRNRVVSEDDLEP